MGILRSFTVYVEALNRTNRTLLYVVGVVGWGCTLF